MLNWVSWNKEFKENWTPSCTLPNKKERLKLYKVALREEKEKMNDFDLICGDVCPQVIIDEPVCAPNWSWGSKKAGKFDFETKAVKKMPYPKADHTHSFATTEVRQPELHDYVFGCKQEGNIPMNYATATVQAGTTETQDQRKYLTRRLDEVFYEKESPLYALFGLTDDEPPIGPKEIAKRIAEGKFIIKGADKDVDEDEDYAFRYWGIGDLIRWRDPAKKADLEGYEAARKDLKKARQEALDTIKIDEPKAGLDAVKAFEAWTPTGAAN